VTSAAAKVGPRRAQIDALEVDSRSFVDHPPVITELSQWQ